MCQNACPKCRVPMMLARVIPEPPDFDLHTFICPECEFVKCVAIEASAMQAFWASSHEKTAPAWRRTEADR
jgi:hypothetical protein